DGRCAGDDARARRPPGERELAVAQAAHRIRSRVRRRVHVGFSLHARRMTSTPMADAPAREPKPLFGWFFVIAVLCVIGVYIRAIYFTPPDVLQGVAQKIFYLHLSAWLSAYLGVSITALMSIVYLWLHDERADRLAEASAEVALIFLTVGLTTGPLWGHAIWGTWWAWWDLRLTLTLFLWFVVAAYLILRGAAEDPAMRARYSAV